MAAQNSVPWMTELARAVPSFLRLPLYRVLIPATHDSASGFVEPRHWSNGLLRYNVTLPYAALKPVLWAIAPYITAWSKTQYGDIAYQLAEGSRAFDVRALYVPSIIPGQPATIATQHGDMWIDYALADLLGQMRQFLEKPENAGEVLILRFGETNVGSAGLQGHEAILGVLTQVLGPHLLRPPAAYHSMSLGEILATGRRVIVQYDGGDDVWRRERGVYGHTDSQWQSAEPGNPANRNHHLALNTEDLMANYVNVFARDPYGNPPEVRWRQLFLQYDQKIVLDNLKHDLLRGKLIPGWSSILERTEKLSVNQAVLDWIKSNAESNTLSICLFDAFTRAIPASFVVLNAMRAGLDASSAQALITGEGPFAAFYAAKNASSKNIAGAAVSPATAPIISVRQGEPYGWIQFAAQFGMSTAVFAPIILLLLAILWAFFAGLLGFGAGTRFAWRSSGARSFAVPRRFR